jgi:hypothetical protein
MALPTQATFSNIGAGSRLSQSYDSNSPHYGQNVLPGSVGNLQDCTTRDIQNISGATKQVSTLNIGTFTAGNYEVRFVIGLDRLAVTVAVEALATDTATTLQAKILDALQASRAGSRIKFASAASTITMTSIDIGTNGGFNTEVVGGGAGYNAVETTPPLDPKALIPGRLLVSIPGEQIAADNQIPNGSGNIVSARYPRTAAELDYIVGILLRSEYTGMDFFGGPSQEAALHPYKTGTVVQRGDIAIEAVSSITATKDFHVYLESAGAKAGMLRSTPDPVAGLTAQIPATALLKLVTYNPIMMGQAGYITLI